MKKCPFCAEEIQDEAIVCKHCGRNLLPVQPDPAPVYQPVSTPTVTATLNPLLAPVVQKYISQGYVTITTSGDTASLEHASAKFNILLFVIFIIFGVIGAVVYALFYIFVIRTNRKYVVQLHVGQDGQVYETGYTLVMHERSKVQTRLKFYQWIGFPLAVIGGLLLLATLARLIAGPDESLPTWAELLPVAITGIILFGALPTGIGLYLLRRANGIKQVLIKQSPTDLLG